MEFEYDQTKSQINKEKHGVDFEEIQQIWLGDYVAIPAITRGEQRYMVIGQIKSILYSCIFTMRHRGKVRIISCRRSRQEEREVHNETFKNSK